MNTTRYELRAVTREDVGDVLELARHLNSVNLPFNAKTIEELITLSERSFAGEIEDIRRREYIFLLYDHEAKRAAGTSLIVAQLGRRDAPYIYFQVRKEERYSKTLDRYFVHDVLKMHYSYNGPTEIGGLVMHPDYRRSPDRLGTMISYVRFLWIAARRELFQDQVLAELLPPLDEDRTSHLWEAVGHQFTGLTYREADHLSKKNKEFIRGLFPGGDIYASVLPPEAQAVIGQVGKQTKGVEKLLRRVGFAYVHRVDPFDGGPHFVANTADIALIQQAVSRPCSIRQTERSPSSEPPKRSALLAASYETAPWFRVIPSPTARPNGPHIEVSSAEAAQLDISDGQVVWFLPLV